LGYFLFLFFTAGNYAKSVSSRIADVGDDYSEYNCGWWMSCNTDDCSVFLDREGSDDATAGLRFPGLFVPQGIKIENAYIQFTAKEVDTGYCKLHIRGHDVDNSSSMEQAFNSDEPTTSAEVIWEPPDWITMGAAGTDQRTPDLSSIIQEIVIHLMSMQQQH
jgi:hypothetical protein